MRVRGLTISLLLRPIIAISIVLLAASAAAQPAVVIKAETVNASVRESFVVQIVISDFETCDAPEFPTLTDVRVVAGGPADLRSMKSDGRRMVTEQSRTYSYELTPLKPGIIEIPAITITVDGKPMKTDPLTIRVRAGEATDLILASISCSAPKLYVGQQAVFTLSIWIKPAKSPNGQLNEEDMFSFLRNGGGSYGEFASAQVSKDRTRREDADGNVADYYLYKLQVEKIVDEPGPPPLGDILVGVNYPVKFQQDRFFGDMRVSRHRNLKVDPTINVPEVLPLPTDGRPANFNGAVGRFKFETAAKPTDVRVGDPIELTLVISGVGPIETMRPPSLATQSALAEGFRVPTEELTGRMDGGRRLLTQFVRAKSAEVKAIPPLEFAYFDPVDGKYVIAKSKPIPLRVTASAEFDASALTNINATASPQTQAVETVDGLRGIEVREERLLASAATITLTHVAAATAAPPVAVLGLLAMMALARGASGSSSAKRRAAAGASARKQLDAAASKQGGERLREIETALAGYLADRLDVPLGRATGAAAIELLQQRRASDDVVRVWRDVMGACESALYAPGGGGDDRLIESARAAITMMERARV